MSDAAHTDAQKSTVLSRDLSDLVIELSIALHKHGMYPGGHPSLEAAESRLVGRLDALLRERQSLSIGVARDQLIIEGVATDPRNSLLHGLARQLHQRDFGAVKLQHGVTREEVSDLLRTLAADPDHPGAEAAGEIQTWQHIRLFPLTYEQLALVDDEAPPTGAPEPRQHAAQLWLDLARAALQSEEVEERLKTDPTVVANAINTHAREQAYDQVIIGYLLKIAGELSSGERETSAALRRRVSQLVDALDPQQLRRLLELGGDLSQRRRFLLDASQGMAVDAVLTLVRAAADASHQVISGSLLRMFAKLAAHAEHGAEPLRPVADAALREQIGELVSGWELPDPSSARYGVMLQRMALDTPLFRVSDECTQPCEPSRIVQMALEAGCVGPAVLRAADTMIERGETGALFAILEQAPDDNDARAALEARVATPDQLRRQLDGRTADVQHIEWLVWRLGARAVDALLDTLATSDARATRRRALDLLSQLGAGIAPAVMTRLPDAPWYLQRNLLILLDRVGAPVDAEVLDACATHADARVRREAVRILLKGAQRAAAISAGARDQDDQVLRLALTAALDGCPADAVPDIIRLLARPDLDPEIELLAVRVLGTVRDAAALEVLLSRATVRRGWLPGRRPRAAAPLLVAALNGLVAHWGDDPRAAAVLAAAARHPDAQVRAAAVPRSADGAV